MRHRSLRNARADDIGAIRSLLAVDDEPVVDRSIGANDDIIGVDDMAVSRCHFRRLTIFDFFRVHSGVDLSSIAKNRASKPLQILERVKGGLSRKAKRGSAVPESEWNAIDQLRIRYSSAVRRFELPFQILACVFTAKKEESFDTLKTAIDVFHRSNVFDPMYRGHVTLGCQPGTFLSMHDLDVVVAIIERGSEVSALAACLTPADWPVINQDNGAASAREQISRGHASDPGSYHADIGAQILRKRLKLRHFGCVHPDGGRVT